MLEIMTNLKIYGNWMRSPSFAWLRMYKFMYLLCVTLLLLTGRPARADNNKHMTSVWTTARAPTYVRLFAARPLLAVVLYDGETRHETIFEPNIANIIGLSAHWDTLGISLSVPAGGERSTTTYGDSRSFDLRLQKYGERSALEFYLQYYRGYYLWDLPDGCDRGDPCSLHPDLRVLHSGFNAHYVNNPDWSIQAAFGYTGHQKKSAGSLILSADLNVMLLDDDKPLQPDMPIPLDGVQYIGGAIVPGYGHTWVRGSWFLTPIVRLGFGVIHANYSVQSGASSPESEWLPSLKLGGRLSTGYAGKKWRTGLQAHLDLWGPINDEGVGISSHNNYLEIFVVRHL